MFNPIFKIIIIYMCAFYFYIKIEKMNVTQYDWLYAILTSIVIFLISSVFRTHAPVFRILLRIIVFTVLITIYFKTPFLNNLYISIISIALSHCISYISLLTFGLLFALIFIRGNFTLALNIINEIIILLGMWFYIFMFFKIKKFKNGIPFLDKSLNKHISVIISCLLLFFISITSLSPGIPIFTPLISISILVIVTNLLLWWYIRGSIVYKYKKQNKDISKLESEIEVYKKEITKLKEYNTSLSSVLHRDNKLIPAMELSVKTLLQNTKSEYAESLLNQLNIISKGRTNIIPITTNSKVCKTNVAGIDSMLAFMYEKAKAVNINFTASTLDDVQAYLQPIDHDITTIIADLIENSIIATVKNENKSIHVEISANNNVLSLAVLDTGIEFEIETFNKFGLKRATTHQNEGGSGIGLVTVFELLKQYKASLHIEEFNSGDFTKKISIIFDELNSFTIKSCRKNEIVKVITRDDVEVIKK